MKCNNCDSTELIRMHQIGVDNISNKDGAEILFDMLICTVCGSIKADTASIRVKHEDSVWSMFSLNDSQKGHV